MVYFEKQLVAIKCQIAPGGFSGERIFVVRLADNESYKSVAPRHFCWNSRGQIVGGNEPSGIESGFVAARRIEELPHAQSIIEVPDGAIIAVDNSNIVERPTNIKPAEKRQDVPV